MMTRLIVAALLAGATVNAQNISLVGELKPSSNTLQYGDVWGEGDLACLGIYVPYTTGGFGVGTISITNPAAPVLLSNYWPAGNTANNQFEQGAVRDRIGYFASWGSSTASGGLHIVSLTNPAAPVLLSRITRTTPGTVTNGHDRVHTMFLDRNFLYEADHATPTVKIFDVSNPSAPFFVRNLVTTNTVRVHQITVATNGSNVRLYTSGWGSSSIPGKTDIWDVTNVGAEAPVWLGAVITGPSAHSSWPTPDGNTLVICRETSGAEVSLWDISTPGAPVLQSQLTTQGVGIAPALPHNPVIIGDLLFVSWYQNGLQVFDISNPALPVRVGSFDTFPGAITSSFQGNWGVHPFPGLDRILLSDMQRGLLIVDASAVLTATNNYPPLIVTQPASQTVTQGMSLNLSATATGSSLQFQWQRNGASLLDETNSTLTVNGVQTGDGGGYRVIVSNQAGTLASLTAPVTVVVPEFWEEVFSDDFDTAASADNWVIFSGSANGIDDYTVAFAFDYSSYFSVFHGTTIPPAPNSSGGTSRGLRLTVNNNDGTGAQAAVCLYLTNRVFTGAYRLKLDMWINYPGGLNGGGAGVTGSTEYGMFGLNHAGTRVNWASTTANPSDGVWFAVNGEGGDTVNHRDYRVYTGRANDSPVLHAISTSGFAAGTSSGSANNTDAYYQGIFPAPSFETPGAPGKRWVEVEIAQTTNNIVTWRMNGHLIAQRSNLSTFTSGAVMIGLMDTFNSIASPAQDSFILFDNVRVEILSTAMPLIVSQPQDQTVFPEEDATFSVAVTGVAPFNYQWRFNGADIPGATRSSYTRERAQPEQAGYYSVVVSNAAGSTVSSNATLLLINAPEITGVTAAPGHRGAIITWTTDAPSDSQVEYEEHSPHVPDGGQVTLAGHGKYAEASHRDPALVLEHRVVLTGLHPNTEYGFQVISRSGASEFKSAGYHFRTAGEIIIDNPAAEFSGTWSTGTSATDKYGSDYRFASTVTAAPASTATFRPDITTPGRYDVYVWHSQGGNRPMDAQFLVSHEGGDETAAVNQTMNGGAWRLIAGNRPFAKGTTGFVRLSNASAVEGKAVIADAVRWVYAEDQDTGTAGAIPSWWSRHYFGSDVDPSIDHDGDGYTTGMEYVLGTNPMDAASRFMLSAVHAMGGVMPLNFSPHHSGRRYEVQGRLDFSASWTGVETSSYSVNEDGEAVVNLPVDSSQGYFRISVTLTPEHTD